MQADIVLKNATCIVTMDDADTETPGDLRIRDGVIVAVGDVGVYPGDRSYDVAGCVVTPGLINTHHHMFQSLTRAVPAAQDVSLFNWLRVLYPIWARMGPDEGVVSTQTALAELALSGCSLSSDHLYLFPNGLRLDDTIHAATQVGVRLLATRGAMSIGESDGGLPPDAVVEDEAAILKDSARLVDAFHDPKPGAMIQVGLAPCSPFSVSKGLMADAAVLAREKGVRLHTHLAEDADDVAYSLEMFGQTPGDYAESLGWVGDDVWHAHCVKLAAREIDIFAQTGTGIAHCPCSNCRLGSGIAPVRSIIDAGVPVGLGVDGSASNDSGNLAAEARQAMLLQRVNLGAEAMTARAALRLATRGGAQVLGRDDLGQLTPGKRADIAVWDVSGIDSAGSADPAAFLLAGPTKVRDLWVEGRLIVDQGRLTTLDEHALVSRHNALAAKLING